MLYAHHGPAPFPDFPLLPDTPLFSPRSARSARSARVARRARVLDRGARRGGGGDAGQSERRWRCDGRSHALPCPERDVALRRRRRPRRPLPAMPQLAAAVRRADAAGDVRRPAGACALGREQAGLPAGRDAHPRRRLAHAAAPERAARRRRHGDDRSVGRRRRSAFEHRGGVQRHGGRGDGDRRAVVHARHPPHQRVAVGHALERDRRLRLLRRQPGPDEQAAGHRDGPADRQPQHRPPFAPVPERHAGLVHARALQLGRRHELAHRLRLDAWRRPVRAAAPGWLRGGRDHELRRPGPLQQHQRAREPDRPERLRSVHDRPASPERRGRPRVRHPHLHHPPARHARHHLQRDHPRRAVGAERDRGVPAHAPARLVDRDHARPAGRRRRCPASARSPPGTSRARPGSR